MTSYIYVTYCKKTLKPYVGQHTWDGEGKDESYYGSGVAIRKDLKERGKAGFSNCVIEYCDSVKELNDKEQYWITELDSMSPNGYNLVWGHWCEKGTRISLETRKKMSLAATGRKHTKETREKLALINTGKKHRPETLAKLALASTGRKHTKDTLEKMSKSQKGRGFTKEHLAKLSAVRKGRKYKKTTCPHCLKSIGVNVAYRWHFDNCKFKP